MLGVIGPEEMHRYLTESISIRGYVWPLKYSEFSVYEVLSDQKKSIAI